MATIGTFALAGNSKEFEEEARKVIYEYNFEIKKINISLEELEETDTTTKEKELVKHFIKHSEWTYFDFIARGLELEINVNPYNLAAKINDRKNYYFVVKKTNGVQNFYQIINKDLENEVQQFLDEGKTEDEDQKRLESFFNVLDVPFSPITIKPHKSEGINHNLTSAFVTKKNFKVNLTYQVYGDGTKFIVFDIFDRETKSKIIKSEVMIYTHEQIIEGKMSKMASNFREIEENIIENYSKVLEDAEKARKMKAERARRMKDKS